MDYKSIKTHKSSWWARLRLAILGRALRPEEVLLVQRVFKTSIDTNKVRIFRRSYLPLIVSASMSPNGNIYFPPAAYEDNFAHAYLAARSHFLHEMTHVWQYQLRLSVRWHGLKTLLRGGYHKARVYQYPRQHALPFADYNFEQQAQLIAHYYQTCECQIASPILSTAVADFIENPSNPSLLPRVSYRSGARQETTFSA